MKSTSTRFPWPEVVLIVGFILSVVIGIAMAVYQKTIEVGILVAVLLAILTVQISIFLEQKTTQRELAFDQSVYRNPPVFDAVSALANSIYFIRQKGWTLLARHMESYVSKMRHISEQASTGRLEELSEEIRQIWLKDILTAAGNGQVFSATSYVNICTWWRTEAGQRYYDANVDAIARGVKVRRVFITSERAKDAIKQEVLRQSQNGVQVRVAFEGSLPAEHQANYSVLERSIATWSSLTPTAGSSEGHVSYAPGDIERYESLFGRLWDQFAHKPNSIWSDVVKSQKGYTISHQTDSDPDSSTVLGREVKNLLYQEPILYDRVYKARPAHIEKLCRSIFDRFLGRTPASILDLGCGTGASLEFLAKTCSDTFGIDGHGPMVEYAQRIRPNIRIRHADIRTLDLGRRFDCVLMLGWVLNYAISNRAAEEILNSVAKHVNPGGIFILELLNGFSFFPGGCKRGDETFKINDSDWSADARVRYELDASKQIVRRTRSWTTPTGAFEDFCPFRLFFPAEIEYLLERFGFRVLAVYDDFSLQPGREAGESLVIVAKHELDALKPRGIA